MATRLLIVEDDIDLQKTLGAFLQGEGFIVDSASTGSEALTKLEKTYPQLVLLDLGLPDIQGESILLRIRQNYPDLPVVILTAKSKPQEIAQGLNLGADDYLSKPFAAEELLARINARIRIPDKNKGILKVADLILDLSRMTVKRAHKNIELTKTEFDLLKYLMENSGSVVSREMILNHVWGFTTEVETRVVDVYVGYIRRKVDGGFKKKIIRNRRGFGYLVEDNNA